MTHQKVSLSMLLGMSPDAIPDSADGGAEETILGRIVSRTALASGMLLFVGFVIHAFFWSISEPGIIFSDFYKAYFPVANSFWNDGPHDGWINGEVAVGGFVNLPIVGYLFVPLVAVGEAAAGWTFLGFGLGVVIAAWALLAYQFCNRPRAAVLLAFLFLVNGPLINSLREGNLTHVVLFLLVLALYLWRSGREIGAGVVFGICAVLKPPLLLLGVFFLIIRRWRVVAGGAAAISAIVVLSFAVHGLDINIDWYRSNIEPYVGGVIPALNNQSLDGFLIRLWTGERYLFDWRPFVPTDLHRTIRLIILPLLYGGVFWAIWRATRFGDVTFDTGRPSRAELYGFCAVLVLALVSSPLTWTHYYLYLLVPFAIFIGDRALLDNDRLSFGLIVAAMVLTSLPVTVLRIEPGLTATIIAKSAISAWFFGGLFFLAACLRTLMRRSELTARDNAAAHPIDADDHAEPPDNRRLTGWFAAFLVFNIVVVNGALWLATPSGVYDSALRHSWDVVRVKVGDDSWGAMAIALEHVEENGEKALYRDVFFNQKIKFQYPPSSLFSLKAMYAIAPEGVRVADDMFIGVPVINDVIGWFMLALIAVSSWLLFEKRLRDRETTPIDIDGQALIRLLIFAGLTLTFYPVVKSATLGQIQLWITGFFALALLYWMAGYRRAAGILIGLACLIKPHYGLLVLWAAWRRAWGFVAGAAATVAVGAAASIAYFGWSNHVDYFQVLNVLSRHGEGFYPNQSLNGLLNRLMSIGKPELYDNLTFSVGRYPPFNPFIYGATLVGSLILLALALSPLPGNRDRITAFCIAALAITLASPIAWEHHFGILLPVFAIAVADAIRGRHGLIGIGICYLVASNYFPITNLLAGSVLNVAQSSLFFAALTLLAILLVGFRADGMPGGGSRRKESLS